MDNNNFESEPKKPAHEHHGHEHEAKADELWEQSSKNEVVVGLKDKEIDELGIEGFERAFSEKPCCLRCSDGRIHEIGLGRAGMGIIAGLESGLAAVEQDIASGRIKANPDDPAFVKHACDAIIDRAAEECAKQLIEEGAVDKDGKFQVTSHDGCGAMGIVCGELKKRGWMPENFNNDELGKMYARRTVQALWGQGYKAGYHHIEAGAMDELHDERAVYLIGNKISFNNETLVKKDHSGKEAKVLPRGFILSALKYDEKVTETELDALCGIAMGSHGFGKRIDSDNPLYIVILAANQQQLEQFRSIAEKVKAKRGSIEIRTCIPSGFSVDK